MTVIQNPITIKYENIILPIISYETAPIILKKIESYWMYSITYGYLNLNI